MRSESLPPSVLDRLHGLVTANVTSLTLDARPMTVIEIEGRPFFVSSEIGEALGYPARSFPARLAEWGESLRPDKDVVKLEGEELRALKDLAVVAKNTPAALLLSESGLYRVLMLSKKPVALRMQEWLADEVLPTLRKTGAYGLPANVPLSRNERLAMILGQQILVLTHEQRVVADDLETARLVLARMMAGATTTHEMVKGRRGWQRYHKVWRGLNLLQQWGLVVQSGDTTHSDRSTWTLAEEPVFTPVVRRLGGTPIEWRPGWGRDGGPPVLLSDEEAV